MYYLHKTTSAVSCVKPNTSKWEAMLRDDIGFATVYRRIYSRKFLTLTNQTSHYIGECIRINLKAPNKICRLWHSKIFYYYYTEMSRFGFSEAKQNQNCDLLWLALLRINVIIETPVMHCCIYCIITETCLCNFDPLKPHFYIVKLGFTVVYISFHISAQNIDCGYSLEPPRRGGSNEYPQSIFWAEIWKKIQSFLSENFQFLMVKLSIYLNRHVSVMVFWQTDLSNSVDPDERPVCQSSSNSLALNT